MRACGVGLSGLAVCRQPVDVGGLCYYHHKLAGGLVALDERTLAAIRSNVEGDRARSRPYSAAMKRVRAAAEEIAERFRLRERRRELETLLLLAAAGDFSGFAPKGGNKPDKPSDQRKQRPKRRVRVWRSVS